MSQLIVSPSPHIHSGASTRRIMLDVIIALCPALIAAGILFGAQALGLVAVCVVSCVLFEWLARLAMKRENTVSDLSAVVTGMLLGFNLPPTLPYYMGVIGSFVAIVIVKQLFGGIGQNFANPAIVGRIVLALSFATAMTTWAKPFFYQSVDAMTSATPLAVIASGEGTLPSLTDMFLGVRGGCLGETSALALLLGGLYLCIRRVITPVAPLAFISMVALLTLIGGGDVAYQVLGGGLLLGAIFMATDYSTTPGTPVGQLIFGLGCGVITFLIRRFASMPEGVSFSILLMNIVTPYIERITMTKPFGAKPVQKVKKAGDAQ